MSDVLAPISVGELLDKITILEIKLAHVRDSGQRRNIEHEHAELQKLIRDDWEPVVSEFKPALAQVNQLIWDLEDLVRAKHAGCVYDEEFVSCAIGIFQRNDERAAIKKRINLVLSSSIVEEKIYHRGGRD